MKHKIFVSLNLHPPNKRWKSIWACNSLGPIHVRNGCLPRRKANVSWCVKTPSLNFESFSFFVTSHSNGSRANTALGILSNPIYAKRRMTRVCLNRLARIKGIQLQKLLKNLLSRLIIYRSLNATRVSQTRTINYVARCCVCAFEMLHIKSSFFSSSRQQAGKVRMWSKCKLWKVSRWEPCLKKMLCLFFPGDEHKKTQLL